MNDPKDLVRLNLKGGQVLLLQATNLGISVLTQILSGFGAKEFHRCTTVKDAKSIVEQQTIDLVLVEGQLDGEGEDGYAFVKWLRSSDLMPNAFAPVLMTVAHTSIRNIARARDCGAHFVIGKPVAPAVLWERILWVSRENRAFVKAGDTYAGPDRRFKNLGPPPGMKGRRATDNELETPAPETSASAEAAGPEASQDADDSSHEPKRVSL